MPVPIVVVELAPPNASAELARALVAACSRAIDRGRCALVADEPENVVPHAIAIVSWQGAEQLRVRIEVGIRRTERAQWLSRTMSFRAEDDPSERWKAAGLTIATLVGEVAPAPDAAADSPRAPTNAMPGQPRPLAARPAPAGGSSGRPRPRLQADGAIRVGAGLESGSLRLGALAAIAYVPGRFPVQPWLSGGYATQVGGGDGIAVSWTTLGAGAAVDVPVATNLALRARSELFLVRVGASAANDFDGRTESGSVWKSGWSLGADGIWPAHAALALTAGWDGWTTSGRVRVRVHDRIVGTQPVFGWAGRLGVRLRFP